MISEDYYASTTNHGGEGHDAIDEIFRQEIDHILKTTTSHLQPPTNAINHADDILIKEQQIVEETWTKFSAKHGISPLNVNNNVQHDSRTGRCRLLSPNSEENGRLVQNNNKKGNGKQFLPQSHSPRTRRRNKIEEQNLILKIIIWSLRLFCIMLKILGATMLTLFVLYCIFILHKPTQRLVSRNTQDLIYPLMRALRLMSIPVVRTCPFLTDYYEESCLIPNPYYEITEMECWPCESVRHVMDLTGFSNFSAAYHHSGIPFVVKDAFTSEINMERIRQIVSQNPDVPLGKAFVETSHFGVTTLENIIGLHYSEAFNSDNFHMKWYINRVVISRLWKNYFPKPYFVPKTTEVSVQHFLFVDRPLSKTYRLPLTEFANVFLTQASGSRSIVLIPTKNCQKECKVVSAVLKPKDVLFYNWLFWRPMSVAADSTAFQTTSVTFLGSFY